MRNHGLARQRWTDPIESFVREHGRRTPRWAIVCTYECDLALLERRLLPFLNRRGREFRTLVLADAGALESQLGADHATHALANLHPIRLQGGAIFHPKLVFLRAGRQARVCFGSANVTNGGFGTKLELWTHSDDPEIIGAFVHFFDCLRSHRKILIDPACARQIERATLGFSAQQSTRVWSSIDQSFESRLVRAKQASTVTIVSPIYAEQKGLARARKIFSSNKLTLYADASVRIPRTSVWCYAPPEQADLGPGEGPDYPRELHAKLYIFDRGTARADVWLGSANFTAQALTRSVSGGGNVECLVHGTVPRDEIETMRAELGRVFEPATQSVTAIAAAPPPPAMRSTILACELVMASAGLRLVIHAIPGTRSVTLQSRGPQVTVNIHRSRGTLQGKALAAAFPELSAECPRLFVIFQVIGKQRFPVVVNAPYVSEAVAKDGQVGLENLLDELRGHIPRPSRHDTDNGADDELEGEPDPEDGDDSDDGDDTERRLDEVRHQGKLDQLAVKAALARKLIIRGTEPGQLRDELLELARVCSASACPTELRPVLLKWFLQ